MTFTDYLHQAHQAAPVIVSLIIIEGLLSVDNMLAIAALASELPGKQKKIALRLGLAGAYTFRIVALFFAGFIMANEWVKLLGALYLIHLMADHFARVANKEEPGEQIAKSKPRTFWGTVIAIQIMDLSLSVDNVVAAVAMSNKLWVVCLGVALGLLTLLLFASVSLKLIAKFPVLQHTAFLLIGYVGMILLTEMGIGYVTGHIPHIAPWQKFIGIAVIVAISMFYDRSPRMQAICRPLIHGVWHPVRWYAWLFGGIIACVTWPFRAVFGLFRRGEA